MEPEENKHPGGRPTIFNQELADQICERISTSSDGLRKICKDLNISTYSVVKWLKDEDKAEFTLQYARAKEAQADFMADEIIEIADDKSGDIKIIYGKGGEKIEVENVEFVNRSKLKVEARKWVAAKLKPKKYGDKLQTEHSGTLEIKQITGMEVK